jgi:hypothetical protein
MNKNNASLIFLYALLLSGLVINFMEKSWPDFVMILGGLVVFFPSSANMALLKSKLSMAAFATTDASAVSKLLHFGGLTLMILGVCLNVIDFAV